MSRKLRPHSFRLSKNSVSICALLLLLVIFTEYFALSNIAYEHTKNAFSNLQIEPPESTTTAPTALTALTAPAPTALPSMPNQSTLLIAPVSISSTSTSAPPSNQSPVKRKTTLRKTRSCKYGKRAYYGSNFSEPVFIRVKRSGYNITRAFGCSTHRKYCHGAIRTIPCCTKIMYDMWYALDEYLTKYGVTYSFHWGSLLMAVRDGRHAVWDAKDLDLGFLSPAPRARAAIAEFMRDYSLHANGGHHINDWEQTFYVAHHQKYGYPQGKQLAHCFYHEVWVAEQGRDNGTFRVKNQLQTDEIFDDEDALILAGTVPFIDYTFGSIKTDGMGNYAKHVDRDRYMVEVEYKGSNGILPPRKVRVFADYYKHLYSEYGDSWPAGYTFLSEKQLVYYGLPPFDDSYFKRIYNQTVGILDEFAWKFDHSDATHAVYYQKFRSIFQ